MTGVTALATGGDHSLAATADGRLYAWGDNSGDGTTDTRLLPWEVATVSGAVAVAAGYRHSVAITSGGTLYTWGANDDGQLGLGDTTPRYSPTLVPGLTDVVAVAAGRTHTLAVTAQGALYAWGGNASGQLGDRSTETRLVPTTITSLTNVVEVAAGSNHSLARLANGDVYAWGYNLHGQLGLGTLVTNVTTPQLIPEVTARLIAAGGSHSLALRSDGVLLAWGLNSSGQLGNGSFESSNLPVALSVPANVAGVSAGRFHSAAVTTTGEVWTWGEGAYGQLGTGSESNSLTPQFVFAAGGTWGGTEAPTLSLPTGTYVGEQTVVVSSTIAGAVLRYALTGTDPTEGDAELVSGAGILIDRSLTLRVRVWAPSGNPSAVVSATYALQPATPTISPGTGTYSGSQVVTIACGTTDVTLRYTLDGSEPTDSSTAYTAPFTIAGTTVVRARAFRSYWLASAIASAVLTSAEDILEAPVASPPAGNYDVPQSVILSGRAGADIRYTIDDTEPTSDSTLYTTPVEIGAGVTILNARAFQTGIAPSATFSATYNIGMASLTVQTFLFDETASDGRGAPAGAGVYVRINGVPVGRTGGNGTLTVTVVPGELTVNAIVPSSSIGEATITIAPGNSSSISIVLDPARDVIEQTDLVLVEAVDRIIPVASPTFTLRFVRAGQVVQITELDRIELLDRFGDVQARLDDLFAAADDGAIVARDAASIYDWLPVDGLASLRVQAMDAEGFTHANITEFCVGRFKLGLRLAAPPSNPALPLSNIELRVSIVGSDISVVRTSDSEGHIEIDWLPRATLAFDCSTVTNGRYHYGDATMLHEADRSGTLVLRHVSDIVAGVEPLILDPMVPTALASVDSGISSPPFQTSPSADIATERREATIDLQSSVSTSFAALSETSTATASALQPVSIAITSDQMDVPVAQTATLFVPQGTQTITLKYEITSLEYPKWVEEQSPFDDIWTVSVYGGNQGQRLFAGRRNVNSQLSSSPAWDADSTTDVIEEDIDVQDLAAQGDVQLTLHGTSVNVRDSLFPTTVYAELGAQKTLTIKSIEAEQFLEKLRPNEHFFSIPRSGNNVFERWLNVRVEKPEGATDLGARVILQDNAGAVLQTLYDQQAGDNVRILQDGTLLQLRVSMHGGITSSVPSTPPTTHFIYYTVVVRANVNGEPKEDDDSSGKYQALWEMPDGFPRYGQLGGDRGGDYWAARGTYQWLERNRGLITRINDVAGEHGRNIGHSISHDRGCDIDMYHVNTFGLVPNDNSTGLAVYERLRNNVIRALNEEDAARQNVAAWITDSRGRFDQLFAVGPGDVELLIYAEGNAWSEQVITPQETVEVFSLQRGWAEELMEMGTVTVTRSTPTGQVLGTRTLEFPQETDAWNTIAFTTRIYMSSWFARRCFSDKCVT